MMSRCSSGEANGLLAGAVSVKPRREALGGGAGVAGNPTLLTNLPTPVSSFIGRDVGLAGVRALVGASRLVTLTGAGVM
jgi:hypothetical protein